MRHSVEDVAPWIWNLQLETLRKTVGSLGYWDRNLIQLRYDKSLTMEEIGMIYGVSKAAVSKCLKKLHEQM